MATRGTSVKSKRIGEVYQGCYRAWRAGAIREWYYGRRSPSDPTIVWEVNGVEVPRELVAETVAECVQRAGISAVVIGPSWCGYPSMTVTYQDGSVLVDSYNGRERVEELSGRVVDDSWKKSGYLGLV